MGCLPLLPPILMSKPDSKEAPKTPFQSSLRNLRKWPHSDKCGVRSGIYNTNQADRRWRCGAHL